MYYILVNIGDNKLFWSEGGLMELRWQATKFATRKEVDRKIKEIERENPNYSFEILSVNKSK